MILLPSSRRLGVTAADIFFAFQFTERMLLQLPQFGDHVAPNEGRIVPFDSLQPSGEDVLLDGIEPVRPRVLPSGVNLRKALVSGPAHKHRAARKQLPQSLPDISVVAVLEESGGELSFKNAID